MTTAPSPQSTLYKIELFNSADESPVGELLITRNFEVISRVLSNAPMMERIVLGLKKYNGIHFKSPGSVKLSTGLEVVEFQAADFEQTFTRVMKDSYSFSVRLQSFPVTPAVTTSVRGS